MAEGGGHRDTIDTCLALRERGVPVMGGLGMPASPPGQGETQKVKAGRSLKNVSSGGHQRTNQRGPRGRKRRNLLWFIGKPRGGKCVCVVPGAHWGGGEQQGQPDRRSGGKEAPCPHRWRLGGSR